MRTYWAWRGHQFLGWARARSPELAARRLGGSLAELRVVCEEDLTLDQWVEADVQMRA